MVSISSSLKLNTNGLDTLLDNIKDAKNYHIKIGILQDSNSRNDGNLGNARIGNFHEQELGSSSNGLVKRSFLRFPLEYKNKEIAKYLEKNHETIMKDLTLDKGIRRIYFKIGTRAKLIIKDAFFTGGFGQWSPLKASTIRRKGNDLILVDSGQLEKAIRFRTDKNGI